MQGTPSERRRNELHEKYQSILTSIDNGIQAILLAQRKQEGIDLGDSFEEAEDCLETVRNMQEVFQRPLQWHSLAELKIVQNSNVTRNDLDVVISVLEHIKSSEELVSEEQWTLDGEYAIEGAKDVLEGIENYLLNYTNTSLDQET